MSRTSRCNAVIAVSLAVVALSALTANARPPSEAEMNFFLGDKLSPFALLDHDGEQVSLADFEGKPLAITFIFTRCPFPEFCPRMMAHFASAHAALLEDETRRLFPKARIARLDRDTARKRSTFESMFDRMTAGDIDILIGTQMITKGHDVPGVTLVGVVLADAGQSPSDDALNREYGVLLADELAQLPESEARGQREIEIRLLQARRRPAATWG